VALVRGLEDGTEHRPSRLDQKENRAGVLALAVYDVERVDASTPLVVFDEIHKYRHWKNYLKGVYDRFHRDYQFLVTGSGRLDVY
jgi:uncharacterized protein